MTPVQAFDLTQETIARRLAETERLPRGWRR
jgi:hypothetical protein